MRPLDGADVGAAAGVGVVDLTERLVLGHGRQVDVLPLLAPVVEASQREAEVLVDGAGEYQATAPSERVALGQVVPTEQDREAVEHPLHEPGIAPHGDPLVAVELQPEVVPRPHVEAAGQAGRQARGGDAPLLLGVALDEGPVDGLGHHRQ